MAAVVVGSLTVPLSATAAIDEVNTTKLRQAVTVSGILQHERALQRIANNAGGTRAAGTPGFTASAAYVKARLTMAGYQVTEQPFEFEFYQEVTPATLSQVSPAPQNYETATFTYSGSGNIVGGLVAATNTVVPATPAPSSASGCAATDFAPASATEPQVALIQRGTCTFAIKTANAIAAGYDAVIIFNEGNPGRTELVEGTLGATVSVPVVGLSYADGAALYASVLAGPTTVAVKTEVIAETRTTVNIIADTRTGNKDKVIVVGAHLDSVLEGPGINDNGSGTATILETAIQMKKLKIQPRQQVRFAFWGAEKLGLLGSENYVASASDVDLAKIYANLNFDMLASPNYVRFVYDGDASADPSATAGPPGSAQIESIFNSYFAAKGLATEPTAFDGRSDYGPFIAVGIPAGGLFSGAEGLKTPEEAVTYGGTAGEAYDACYHQACDSITNLNTKAIDELGDAAVHAIMTLARSSTGFFEDGSRMAPRELQSVPASEFDYKGSSLVR
ncbi:M28 family peptidase [Cryobacterium ruanii]|uniref:M28 family peptidase n=1 Tax=Cryobacterium ruanii TaxID=1259197 RepID=A0A4R9AQD7_9MICO|nr:M28 family peptidase [Cryobacterium ruanii]TFD67937.1 M28 family peptidase [Cryobacterium ruanii]